MSKAAQTIEPLPGMAAVRATIEGCHVEAARRPSSEADSAASAIVPAPPDRVFAFLSDLENHWRMADRFVEVITLEGPPGGRTGGVVALRGPLGLRRTVRTRVLAAAEPRYMAGTAEIARGTLATVRWSLEDLGSRTGVVLSATVETVGLLDRVLLAAGGRWWLRRRFASTLSRLAARFSVTGLDGRGA
jgi:hypothetical protein